MALVEKLTHGYLHLQAAPPTHLSPSSREIDAFPILTWAGPLCHAQNRHCVVFGVVLGSNVELPIQIHIHSSGGGQLIFMCFHVNLIKK